MRFVNRHAKVITGGGYCLSAALPHFSVLSDIIDQLNAAGGDVAVLFLSYTLAPKASYPHQLSQGVELLRYTLQNLGRKPSDLVLCGDSAGGNLALGVLSHLSHPHPSIPPLELSEPLRAAILIAPWVSFDTTAESFRRNQYKDCIGPASLIPWSKAFMGRAPADNYNQPIKAPVDWWKDLKVEEVLILAGAEEVLVDYVKEVARKIEVSLGSCGGGDAVLMLDSLCIQRPPPSLSLENLTTLLSSIL